MEIREQDPLKQGLKLISSCPPVAMVSNSRARSIKTRIETSRSEIKKGKKQDSRARSIKTRIETIVEFYPFLHL